MPVTDPRVDAYMAKSAAFAQPVLAHLRAIVHDACPEVEETMKWSFPHFMYKGMMCSMASFKAHCAFSFWKAELLMADDDVKREAMGHFGRLTAVADLPSKKVLTAYIKQAMKLNDEGVVAPARAKSAPRVLTIPDDLNAALDALPAARQHFDSFTPGKQREYADWLDEAKTETTRARRRTQAIEWIAEGKSRNWKYEKC